MFDVAAAPAIADKIAWRAQLAAGAMLNWQAPALSDGILHELRLFQFRTNQEAVWRHIAGRVQALEAAIVMAPGAHISFNTYLNSFYEHYWSSHAPLQDLTIRLFGVGDVMVDMYRGLPDGSAYCITRKWMTLDLINGGTMTAELCPAPAGAGRIFFNVLIPKDTAKGATLTGGRLETATKPVRPVRLGIGLCTFNREHMLFGNLQRIVESAYFRWASPKLFIVNQGKPFAAPEMLALLAAHADAIKVITQANFGGAGGFTRAAMEITQDGECSHVLFMDDDIAFEPDVLATTHAFCARTTRPTAVGGAMIDLYRPSMIYEAGATISPANIIQPLLHNRNMNELPLLDQLSRENPCHFSGWWYCAIPVEMFREHGLPLPIFIRGDDMEYGARLAAHGVKTVCLPPLSVWHEPFYAKAPGWQRYYDLRNRLIFAATSPWLARLDSFGTLARRLVDCLLKHDYQHAALMILAVEHFLSGPACLDMKMDVRHQEISALAAAQAAPSPISMAGITDSTYTKPPPAGRGLTLLAGLIKRWRGPPTRSPATERIYVDQWHPWMTMGRASYILSDKLISFGQAYRYDKTKFRVLARRGIAALWRYRREAQAIAKSWENARAGLTAHDRWEQALGVAMAAPSVRKPIGSELP